MWSAIPKDCASFGCPAPQALADEAKQSGRAYDEYFVRHWTSWATPGTYNRIFAFDVADGKVTGGGEIKDSDQWQDKSFDYGAYAEVASGQKRKEKRVSSRLRCTAGTWEEMFATARSRFHG